MAGLPSRSPKKGEILQKQLTEKDAVNGVLTFPVSIHTIEIFNNDSIDGTFNVNGIDIKIPAGVAYEAIVGGTPSPTVTVTGATSYMVSLYT